MRATRLAVLLTLGLVSLSGADPRVLGRTETQVRILRGKPPEDEAVRDSADTAAPGASASVDSILAGPPPSQATPEAQALARRLIQAYGGPAALTAWLERGERRGRQTIHAPARMEGTFVERRAEGRVRVDVETSGLALSVADGPEGGWQRFLGLVSDLPKAQADELEQERAHDESLLLLAASGESPATVIPWADRPALAVWGSRGSATLFVPGPGGTLDQIRFQDRSALRQQIVSQALVYSDWRELTPEKPGLSGPVGARVPFGSRHLVEGDTIEEIAFESVDLLAAIDDSVFARPGASERTTGPVTRAVLPLTRRGEHHFAEVSIDGGAPRRFLIDTGAGMTAISRELADTLGLPAGIALGIVGLGGGVDARSTTLASVGLGTLTRHDVPCLVLDFAEMRRTMGLTVEGILGFSALNRYAVTFDFDHGTLELAQNAPARQPGAGGARVPIEMLGGQALVGVAVDGGAPAPFILDTGSWITFVPASVGRGVRALRRVPGIAFVGADGRVLEAEGVRARSLSIGAARVERPVLLFATSGGEKDPVGLTLSSGERGVLGANVLRRFRVTLDYPRGELILEPSKAKPDEEGLAVFGLVGPGITLQARDGGYVVRSVVAESPAARAGVRPGDRILAIDDLGLAGVGLVAAQHLLSGPAGTSVHVRLGAAGGERQVRLARVALL